MGQYFGAFFGFSGFWRDIKFCSGNRARRVDICAGPVLSGFRRTVCEWGADFQKSRGTLFSVQYIAGARARRVDISGGLVLLGFRRIMCGWEHILRNLVGHYFRCNIWLVHACR